MSASPPPRRFVLCADDYGLSPGVGTAIRDLIEQGRLSATSCMTVCPGWADEAAKLKPLGARADIGLHLTLTDQAPLGSMPRLAPAGRLPPLGRLMPLALTRRLNRAEIDAEVRRQVDAFTAAFGTAPAFIDGHQHVHQLPIIRDAVIAALKTLPGAYARLCRDPAEAIARRGIAVPKTLLISGLGQRFAALAHRHGVPVNASFRGVYDFATSQPFPEMMGRFLDRMPPGTLVMVHPGIPDEELRRADPLVGPRAVEYEYLRSPAFSTLLDGLNLRPGRFAEAMASRG
ncbi:putative glycoside hydrolase/deacetylase ChbG (UPF0249 family) [Azospirillum fermentarium]|uniref:ChbG/HpnK family deacetylase n=1 Tax=Azospirillum fermentarium TaxID=1233114 RepID=UPI00222669A2|nr:ChbG/HpnK family deacetylase [Azospirillum fermentarium]MCW2245957.1 putative glycoside hydrolase/deacetylase ChbG (UPF0249 family) [Azospirillum fermentarium]